MIFGSKIGVFLLFLLDFCLFLLKNCSFLMVFDMKSWFFASILLFWGSFLSFLLDFCLFLMLFSVFLSFFDPKSIKIDTFLLFFCCFSSFSCCFAAKSVFWVIFGSKRAKIDQKWPPGGGVPGGSQNGSRGTQNGPKVPKKCQFWSLFLIFGPPQFTVTKKKNYLISRRKTRIFSFFFPTPWVGLLKEAISTRKNALLPRVRARARGGVESLNFVTFWWFLT